MTQRDDSKFVLWGFWWFWCR